jgi:hypothetical protein
MCRCEFGIRHENQWGGAANGGLSIDLAVEGGIEAAGGAGCRARRLRSAKLGALICARMKGARSPLAPRRAVAQLASV